MAKIRQTQELVQVVYDEDPSLVATLCSVYVIYDAEPALRVTEAPIYVVYDAKPTLRVTEAPIYVVYDAKPTLRVTEAPIYVVYKESTVVPIEKSADSTISLVSDATFEGVFLGVADSTLTLSDEALPGVIDLESVTDTLSALDDEAVTYINRRIGNTVLLKQQVALETLVNAANSLELTLTQTVDVDHIGTRSASNSFTFTGTATTKRVLPTKTADNALVFSDEAVGFRNCVNVLTFTQLTTVVKNETECVSTNALVLSHTVSTDTVFNLSATSALVFTHIATGKWFGTHNLYDTLDLRQLVYGTLLDIRNNVLLQAPWGMIQTSVILPSPEFQDTENLVSNINIRRSMNGKTYSYVKSSDNRLLRYTFILPRMKALELQSFVRCYNGAPIKLTNWKGEVWKVNLTNNPVDFVQTTRYVPTTDRTDVSLEFEGVKISG